MLNKNKIHACMYPVKATFQKRYESGTGKDIEIVRR